jgi:hypothetical protein
MKIEQKVIADSYCGIISGKYPSIVATTVM